MMRWINTCDVLSLALSPWEKPQGLLSCPARQEQVSGGSQVIPQVSLLLMVCYSELSFLSSWLPALSVRR